MNKRILLISFLLLYVSQFPVTKELVKEINITGWPLPQRQLYIKHCDNSEKLGRDYEVRISKYMSQGKNPPILVMRDFDIESRNTNEDEHFLWAIDKFETVHLKEHDSKFFIIHYITQGSERAFFESQSFFKRFGFTLRGNTLGRAGVFFFLDYDRDGIYETRAYLHDVGENLTVSGTEYIICDYIKNSRDYNYPEELLIFKKAWKLFCKSPSRNTLVTLNSCYPGKKITQWRTIRENISDYGRIQPSFEIARKIENTLQSWLNQSVFTPNQKSDEELELLRDIALHLNLLYKEYLFKNYNALDFLFRLYPDFPYDHYYDMEKYLVDCLLVNPEQFLSSLKDHRDYITISQAIDRTSGWEKIGLKELAYREISIIKDKIKNVNNPHLNEINLECLKYLNNRLKELE